MGTQHPANRFFHRPIRVIVRFPCGNRELVTFIEDEGAPDSGTPEVKCMVEPPGWLSPQYERLEID
jgi:hypothetical protein